MLLPRLENADGLNKRLYQPSLMGVLLPHVALIVSFLCRDGLVASSQPDTWGDAREHLPTCGQQKQMLRKCDLISYFSSQVSC